MKEFGTMLDFNDPANLRKFAMEIHRAYNRLDEELEEQCDYEVMQKRLEICQPCEHFRKRIGQCAKCGCKLVVKTSTIYEECPIGKWGWDVEGWNKEAFVPLATMMGNEYKQVFVDAGYIKNTDIDEMTPKMAEAMEEGLEKLEELGIDNTTTTEGNEDQNDTSD